MWARYVSCFVLTLVAGRSGADERPIQFQCRGLDGYVLHGTQDVDWVAGFIRAESRDVMIGFSVGLVEETVPARRPAGFRTFVEQRIGSVVLRHGLNAREKQYQATLIGAPFSDVVNLAAPPRQEKELLAVARRLATADCRQVRAEVR